MRELPESWATIQLGKLNQFKSKNITPSDYPEQQFELWSVPIFSSGSPEYVLGQEIGSSKQLVDFDDVLLCKINPRINRVWHVNRYSDLKQIASSEWIVVRSLYHDSRYLKHYFCSSDFRYQLCSDLTGVGGSLTRAQPARVSEFEIPLPPLNEQK